jgi:hypothetical protein
MMKEEQKGFQKFLRETNNKLIIRKNSQTKI